MQSANDESTGEGSPVAFFVHLQDEVLGRSGSTHFTGAMQDIAASRGVELPWGMAPSFVVAAVYETFVWARDTRSFDLKGFFAIFAVPQGAFINQVVVDEFVARLESKRPRRLNLDPTGRKRLAIVAIMTVARRWLSYCQQMARPQTPAPLELAPSMVVQDGALA